MAFPENRDREIDLRDPRQAKLRSARRNCENVSPKGAANMLAKSGFFEYLQDYLAEHPSISLSYPHRGFAGVLEMSDFVPNIIYGSKLNHVEVIFISDISFRVFTSMVSNREGLLSLAEPNSDFSERLNEKAVSKGQALEAIRDALMVAEFDQLRQVQQPKTMPTWDIKVTVEPVEIKTLETPYHPLLNPGRQDP